MISLNLEMHIFLRVMIVIKSFDFGLKYDLEILSTDFVRSVLNEPYVCLSFSFYWYLI